MMRRLFVIALLINVVYIAWNLLKPTDRYADLPEQGDVNLIILASELVTDENNGAQDEVTKSAKEPDSEPVERFSKNPEPLVQDLVKLQAKAKPEPESPVVAGSDSKPDAAEEEGGQPGNNADKEDAASANNGITDVSAADDASAPAAAKQKSCYSLGPFLELEKLQAVTHELKPHALVTDYRGEEENRLAMYWVYIQPEDDRTQAIETARRLKSKNIKDLFIIRQGDKLNGISLGYFRSEQRARRLEKKVKDLEFDVVIDPIYKNLPVYWLDYELDGNKDIAHELIENYNQSNNDNKINIIDRICKD